MSIIHSSHIFDALANSSNIFLKIVALRLLAIPWAFFGSFFLCMR